jgi:simple sugar transport system substrate-binding protein
MTPVGERYGVAENVDDSRRTALDLMSANPNLRGFLAFGSQGPIGAGRAVEERRAVGNVFRRGTLLARAGARAHRRGRHLGRVHVEPDGGGRVFVTLGDMLVDGTEITSGMEIPGLASWSPDAEAHDIITNNLIPINAETVDGLADMGL